MTSNPRALSDSGNFLLSAPGRSIAPFLSSISIFSPATLPTVSRMDHDSDSGIDEGIQITSGPTPLTQKMTAIPINELCKWAGISYIDHKYLENIKLAYIFQEVTALITTSDDFYLVGRNVHGSLGTASTVSFITKVPFKIDSLCRKNIRDFAFSTHKTPKGAMSLFALSEDGSVYSWGYNGQGQLGQKSSSNEPYAPRKVAGLPPVKQIVSGGGHTLTLSYDGEVWSWGRNIHGQVGKGTMQDHYFPVNISSHFPEKVVEISCGKNHSVALTAQGHVYTWGNNKKGQLGVVVGIGGVNPDFTLTPKRIFFDHDETIRIKKISAGKNHCLALTSKGKLYAWGHGKYGQICSDKLKDSLVPIQIYEIDTVEDIACVPHLSVSTCYSTNAVEGKKTAFMWGHLCDSDVHSPWETFLRTIPDIYASYVWPPSTPKPISRNDIVPEMTLPFDSDLMKWSAIKTLKPDFLPKVKLAFVCGTGYEQTVCLVTFTDDFYFVGKNVFGSLGTGVSVDFEKNSPIKNQTLSGKRVSDFVFGLDVDGGAMCLFALTEVGTIYSWGYNEFAELGLGFLGSKSEPNTDAVTPTKIQGALKNVKVKQISGGADHYFAISEDGDLYGWGYNFYGQVGGKLPSKRGEETFVLSPVKIKFPKGVKIKQATGGNMHSVAITTEGKVYAWGRNDDHRLQLGIPTNEVWCETPSPVKFPTSPSVRMEKICCGPDNTLALSENCELFFWGKYDDSCGGKKFPTPLQICKELDPICDIGTAQWSSIYAVQTTTNKIFVWGDMKGEDDPVLKPKEEFRASSISDVFAILSTPSCMLKPLRITKK